MNQKLVFVLTLTLLIGMLVLPYEGQKVTASGTIYIRADGSIDPPTAPITTADNVTYTFIGDISDPIIVERDNTLIDGEGYMVQTASYQIGITLSYRSNVTVKNTVVRGAFSGIYLNYTATVNLIDNRIMNNLVGIALDNSSNCRINGNSVTASQYDGIQLNHSSENNSVSENNIVANSIDGIGVFESSSNNTISRNNILRNSLYGISVNDFVLLDSSINNTISENNVTNNGDAGINLESSFNTVVGNGLSANNGTGINLLGSSNTVSVNNITENTEGIYLYGSSNKVFGNNISANNGTGIYITESSNNTIFANNIADNSQGINFYDAHNDSIFHNNFVDNARQIEGEYFTDIWDNGSPSGGNYWSDYNGTDTNHDGIGDTSYVIDANNADYYPLMVQTVIPEFPSFLILPIFFITTLFSAMIYKKKKQK